eukprot:758178-Hanusia_phi.AAC.5
MDRLAAMADLHALGVFLGRQWHGRHGRMTWACGDEEVKGEIALYHPLSVQPTFSSSASASHFPHCPPVHLFFSCLPHGFFSPLCPPSLSSLPCALPIHASRHFGHQLPPLQKSGHMENLTGTIASDISSSPPPPSPSSPPLSSLLLLFPLGSGANRPAQNERTEPTPWQAGGRSEERTEERERHTHTDRVTDTQRHRDTQTHRHTHRQAHRQTHRGVERGDQEEDRLHCMALPPNYLNFDHDGEDEYEDAAWLKTAEEEVALDTSAFEEPEQALDKLIKEFIELRVCPS